MRVFTKEALHRLLVLLLWGFEFPPLLGLLVVVPSPILTLSPTISLGFELGRLCSIVARQSFRDRESIRKVLHFPPLEFLSCPWFESVHEANIPSLSPRSGISSYLLIHLFHLQHQVTFHGPIHHHGDLFVERVFSTFDSLPHVLHLLLEVIQDINDLLESPLHGRHHVFGIATLFLLLMGLSVSLEDLDVSDVRVGCHLSKNFVSDTTCHGMTFSSLISAALS